MDLLKVKWNSFVKRTFYTHLLIFSLYFILSSCCFVMRGSTPEMEEASNCTSNSTDLMENATDNILQRLRRENLLFENNLTESDMEQDRTSDSLISSAIADIQNFPFFEVNNNNTVNETLGCGEDSEDYNQCFHNTYDSLDKQVRHGYSFNSLLTLFSCRSDLCWRLDWLPGQCSTFSRLAMNTLF